jgi:hypothetical protein
MTVCRLFAFHDISLLDLPPFLVEFKNTVQSSIPKLVEMVVNNDNEDVRTAGIKSLAALADDGVWNSATFVIYPTYYICLLDNFRALIEAELPESLESVLKNSDWRVRAGWINILAILSKNCMLLNCLF